MTVVRPAVEVLEGGLLTTVQDGGRWGLQHLGVPVGGPMDPWAFRMANQLVGNDDRMAGLEITMAGPTLRLTAPLTLAVTGAAIDLWLDEAPMAAMQAVTVPDAATLRFGTRRDGARAYLAFCGGIDRPLVLGSRSTTIGTCGGRPLRAGDRLMIGAATARLLPGRVDAACRDRHETALVRVLRGPDVPEGGAAVLDALCATVYTVSSQSNRMAYRLQGAPVDLPAPRRLSSGTVWGALQIPPDGQPLLLLADRQTTGGYPIAAVVISADASRVAQLAPGDRCRFTLCSRREALAALLAMEQDILRLG